jgi:hypothetical protein
VPLKETPIYTIARFEMIDLPINIYKSEIKSKILLLKIIK